MNKIFYLKTCDTCKKILSQIENIDRFKLIEIKSNLLNQQQLEEIYQKVGNYESLINKRATL